jgi:hypothetical protein
MSKLLSFIHRLLTRGTEKDLGEFRMKCDESNPDSKRSPSSAKYRSTHHRALLLSRSFQPFDGQPPARFLRVLPFLGTAVRRQVPRAAACWYVLGVRERKTEYFSDRHYCIRVTQASRDPGTLTPFFTQSASLLCY